MGSLGLGRGADTRVKTRGERLQQGSRDDRCGGAHSQGVEEVSNTAGGMSGDWELDAPCATWSSRTGPRGQFSAHTSWGRPT